MVLYYRLIFALLISLLFTTQSFGATYYVDYVSGDDTNNGTATGTPFQHSPGDDNATDTAGGTSLSAGDLVIFHGGIRYVGRRSQ